MSVDELLISMYAVVQLVAWGVVWYAVRAADRNAARAADELRTANLIASLKVDVKRVDPDSFITVLEVKRRLQLGAVPPPGSEGK